MKILTLSALALALLITGCSKAPEAPAKPTPAVQREAGIDWIRPTTLAEVDRAFETAKARKQPVFLFWTAVWCPPCNQVKSTIFTRADFIEKSRSFVPVYVDADSPSGQARGQRFNVSGYPTMVLLNPEGQERTRLAGSVDAAKYMQLLERGLAGGNSARQALEAALDGKVTPGGRLAHAGVLCVDGRRQRAGAGKRRAVVLCPSSAAHPWPSLRDGVHL